MKLLRRFDDSAVGRQGCSPATGLPAAAAGGDGACARGYILFTIKTIATSA